MFRPFDATNAPGTCRWCGRELRRWYVTKWAFTEKAPQLCEAGGYRPNGCRSRSFTQAPGDPTTFECDRCGRKRRPRKMVSRAEVPGARGDKRDGLFCGNECARQFAVEMVESGRVFLPRRCAA